MDNKNGMNYNDSINGNGQTPDGYNQEQPQQNNSGSEPLYQQQGYQPDAYLNQQQGYQGSGPLYQQQGYQGSGPLYQQQGYQGSGPLNQQQGYQGSGPLNQQQGYQGSGPLYQQQGYQGSGPLYQQGYPGNGPVYQQTYNNGGQPTNVNIPKKNKGCLLSFLIVQALIILALFIMAFAAIGSDDDSSSKSSSKSKQKVTSSTTESKTESTTEKKKESTAEATTEATTEAASDNSDDTYESNQYYEIVEEASYKNSIDYTIIIHKVLAKQDASVDSSVIAYDESGNVIGKSSSDVELTEGEYNYFEYHFEADVSNATFEYTANADEPSWSIGDRDAVEMVEYNVSGDNLYITLKQTSDNLGAFSKFKILFYKNGEIVDSEEGYMSVYAENLSGKDTTDVAEIWVWGKDFDDIEYIYEP